MKNRKIKFSVIAKYGVLVFMAIVTIYPLFWIAISSFKTSNEIYARPFSLPTNPQWGNYKLAWVAADVPLHMMNSLLYSTITISIVIILSSMSSYVIARIVKNRIIYNYYSLGIMIPINAIIIPFILIFRNLNVMNSRLGIILAFVITNLAFSIFILVPFMESLPDELEDAAMLDGCGKVKTFIWIILPISKAGLATVGTFVLINCWNDLFLSLMIISKQNLITLNQVCYNMRAQYVSDYGLISAVVMVLVIPVIVFYSLFQKQIVKGMMAGSIKG